MYILLRPVPERSPPCGNPLADVRSRRASWHFPDPAPISTVRKSASVAIPIPAPSQPFITEQKLIGGSASRPAALIPVNPLTGISEAAAGHHRGRPPERSVAHHTGPR